LNDYINNIFTIITNEGIKFFDECNFELCYKSILRPIQENKKSQYKEYYQTYLDSFNEYCLSKNLDRPVFSAMTKQKWYSKLFKLN